MTTDLERAVAVAREIVHHEDNRDSFPDCRPQWSKNLELLARALLDLMEWRPIETAPKDGSAILIWQPNNHFSGRHRESYMPTDALKYVENSYKWDDPRLKWFDDKRYAIGYWRPWAVEGTTEHPWGNRNSSWPTPTRWLPLPPPPVERKKDA